MDAEKMNLTSELEGLCARDRERRMLEVIGRIARGEIFLTTVDSEADLRQLAYLAAISRNRVLVGEKNLTEFLRAAMAQLSEFDPPEVAEADDPLQARFGARWSIDPGKVRAEADLHTQAQSGQAPTSILPRIRRQNADERRALLHTARDRVMASARELGVEVCIFGSVAEGRVDNRSDLDVMILGDLDLKRRIEAILAFEHIGRDLGVPVDIVVQSEMPADFLEAVSNHLNRT